MHAKYICTVCVFHFARAFWSAALFFLALSLFFLGHMLQSKIAGSITYNAILDGKRGAQTSLASSSQ
jgi:hypothetical protein